MSYKDQLLQTQKEAIAQRQAELAQAQEERAAYLESEQHERDAHEHYQDLWAAKAKKEGWTYKREPFVSAADRQRMAEEAKQREIAYLKEKLSKLEAM